MKFSARTLSILKNFQTINPSIQFKEGNILKTISQAKTIFATATISETIQNEFCIYELSKFISTLTLFEEPDFNVDGKVGVITSGNRKVKYGLADESVIVTPPSRVLTLPEATVSFTLTNEVFTATQKALNILGLSNVAFIGDGEKITITALDNKGALSDSYSAELGETDKEFKVVFAAENLKLLPDDYEVQILGGVLAKFSSNDVEYLIPVEK